MTRQDLLERGRGAARWARANPLVVGAILAGLVAFGVVRGCNRGADAERRATAAEQREDARAAGVPAVQPVEDLRPQLEDLLRENGLLREQLERARRAVPAAKPAGIVRASTGAIAAAGPPRPPAACPTSPPTEEAGKPAAVCPPCLLAPGDMTELKVDEVLLETKAGAHLLVGTASAWRLEPGPPAPIASGAFQAPFTVAVEKQPSAQPAPRWGLGPAVGVSTGGGLLYGATLASPDVRVPLLGWRLSLAATAGAGPGGGAGFVAAVVRP